MLLWLQPKGKLIGTGQEKSVRSYSIGINNDSFCQRNIANVCRSCSDTFLSLLGQNQNGGNFAQIETMSE